MTTEAPEIETEQSAAAEPVPAPVAPPPSASAPPASDPVPVAEEPKVEKKAEEDIGPEVLSLVELTPKRRLVKVPTKDHPEGADFEMRLLDDFGIEMQQKLMAWGRLYQRLLNTDREELLDDGEILTESERARLRFCMEGIFNNVLDAPVDIKAGMDDAARQRVVTTFSLMPVVTRSQQQTALIRRLMEKGHLKEEHVDEVLEEMRQELASISAS